MLRVFLVTSPRLDQVPALAESLRAATRSRAVAGVVASEALTGTARPLGAALDVGFSSESVLDAGADAVALIEARAVDPAGPLVLVLVEAVARAVVTHALDAAVAGGRIAFDPGGIAEIEVRLDAPWTVNRLNDLCHQEPTGGVGIVRT